MTSLRNAGGQVKILRAKTRGNFLNDANESVCFFTSCRCPSLRTHLDHLDMCVGGSGTPGVLTLVGNN